jgi:hypothetical protein
MAKICSAWRRRRSEVHVQTHRQLHQLLVLAGAVAEGRDLEQRLSQCFRRPRGEINRQPVVLGAR